MDTIVAPITPMVQSAVILIRISGPGATRAFRLLRSLKGDVVEALSPRLAFAGRFVSENPPVQDDILATYFPAPHSYTGEDTIEISFHGNPLIVTRALSALYALGIRDAQPGEFTKMAFVNGKLDLTQAEAVQELISTKSDRGVFFAFEQLHGSVKREMMTLKDSLADALSVVEAYVDFPEEDLSDANLAYVLERLDTVIDEITRLIDTYEAFRYYRDGITLAIVGRPNVGKSSLMNALLRYERALVSDVPGTTRDFIQETLSIRGIPLTIVDTAGVRFTSDAIEQAGIARAVEKINGCDLVLVLLDMSEPLTEEDTHVLEMTASARRIVVGNKADVSRETSLPVDLAVSVKHGTGMDALLSRLHESLVSEEFEKHHKGIVVNERQKAVFEEMAETLAVVRGNFRNMTLDVIALDMQRCIRFIGELTGQVYTEEILDRVFSRFCIGK